jgi:hypothetical protein
MELSETATELLQHNLDRNWKTEAVLVNEVQRTRKEEGWAKKAVRFLISCFWSDLEMDIYSALDELRAQGLTERLERTSAETLPRMGDDRRFEYRLSEAGRKLKASLA